MPLESVTYPAYGQRGTRGMTVAMTIGRMVTTAVLLLCASGGLTDPAAAAPADAVVATKAGRLQGVAKDGIVAFKAIPFAQPPLGPLRWRAPQPMMPWPGVRDAGSPGPACPQHNPAQGGYGPDPVQSEDCLTLNIWKPRIGTARLPVMVWIYGGSFVRGDAAHPMFDGAALARDGVIVVTANYRLGRLGWFAHPALTGESASTGNFGLMDQIAALKWVHDNIAGFGGDPANVTIFGESAGAMSVNLLMAAPDARGLFAKAITQSGLGRIAAKPLAVAEAQGEAFARAAGAADLAALRALPVETVLAGQSAATGSDGNPAPIVDGVLVRENVDRSFADGRQAPVPWLVGSNDYEADLFSNFLEHPDAAVFSLFPEADRPRMMTLFDPDRTSDKKVIAANIATDYAFTEPARFFAAAQTRLGQPVYRYFFTYVPEGYRNATPGAGHAAEVQFVFGTLGSFRWSTPDYVPFDRRIAADMGRYWTNFAKRGDPNGPGLVAWPIDKGDHVLVFDRDGEHAETGLRKPRLDFLAAHAAVK
ncbi:carboxylesterase family protein [Sphingomonas sp. ZT3P38]|uniref:carboxylesterase/lipase family protein n=1 Tax=Parasphingomonas zepuensis TaxID=3096161 RepID=UPI002FC5D595